MPDLPAPGRVRGRRTRAAATFVAESVHGAGAANPSREAEGTLGVRLSIGALSKATGIPVETLRTWEARYGFPVPERKPSGHRLYPAQTVSRLRRIAEALSHGHRASEAVPAGDDALSVLVRTRPWRQDGRGVAGDDTGPEDLTAIVGAVADLDAAALRGHLEAAWARLGLPGFVTRCVGPLLTHVGAAWRTGALEVRHEHFLTEQVGDLLRSLRVPFDARAHGPLLVLATLSGETHGLGLQMAALVGAAAGCRVLFLGTDVPVAQIAAVAQDIGARAVALSISSASDAGDVARQLRDLRAGLPQGIEVVAGGEGAPRSVDGVHVLADFEALRTWCETLTR